MDVKTLAGLHIEDTTLDEGGGGGAVVQPRTATARLSLMAAQDTLKTLWILPCRTIRLLSTLGLLPPHPLLDM